MRFPKVTFILLIITILTSNLWADISIVLYQKAQKAYSHLDYPSAISLMREAIAYSPREEKYWSFYDKLVIQFEKYKEKNKNLILYPKFNIKFKEIKSQQIFHFKNSYLKIEGKVFNLSDLSFPLVKVKLRLFKGKKQIAVYEYPIDNFSSKSSRVFYFNKLVPAFSDYKVEVEVVKKNGQ